MNDSTKLPFKDSLTINNRGRKQATQTVWFQKLIGTMKRASSVAGMADDTEIANELLGGENRQRSHTNPDRDRGCGQIMNNTTRSTEKRMCRCMFYKNEKQSISRTSCQFCALSEKWTLAPDSRFSIIGYEVPMERERAGLGGVDLVIADRRNPPQAYALEIKPARSKETLVRMVAEILTYFPFMNDKGLDTDRRHTHPGIAFFANSSQSEDFEEFKDKIDEIKKLIPGFSVFQIVCEPDPRNRRTCVTEYKFDFVPLLTLSN